MDCVGFVFKLGVHKSHWTGLSQTPDLGVSWKGKDTYRKWSRWRLECEGDEGNDGGSEVVVIRNKDALWPPLSSQTVNMRSGHICNGF